MKKNFRFLTGILAVLMLCPLVVSCAQGEIPAETTVAQVETTASSETGDPTVDENGYLKDDLPAGLNFNTTITTLYANDFLMKEFFADNSTGDFIDDAIFNRNAAVEERLGVKLEFVGIPGGDGKQDGYLAKAQADAQSGSGVEYDIYGGYSRTIPLLQLNGLCVNLLETEYIDIDKPWWPEALTNELTIKNKLYFCTGDISTNLLWMMSGIFFNAQMWEDSNFGVKLYDLVAKNEWTLDTFAGFVKDFYQDDGNGIVDPNDIFGLCAYNTCLDAFQNASGIISIVKDGNGDLVLSDDYKSVKMNDLVQKCGEFFATSSVHHSSKSADENSLFVDGHSLFMIDGLFVVRGRDNGTHVKIEIDYGLLPVPKYSADQENFITNVRYPFNFYAINTMSRQINVSSAVIECLASEGYRKVTPMVFEGAMKTRYSPDSETSQMYDILREGVCFDLGRIYGYALDNYYPKFRNTALDGGRGWASLVKSIDSMTKKKIETIMDTYKD